MNGHVANGHADDKGRKAETLLYDPDFTARVTGATGKNAHPRLAQIMPSLLRHLHDFAREVDLTVGEWMAGVRLINEAGQMSNDSRNETQLLCDILGLESLVDEITSKKQQQQQQKQPNGHTSSSHSQTQPPLSPLSLPLPLPPRDRTADCHPATSSAILGPFYRHDAPILPPYSPIVSDALLATNPDYASRLALLTGHVLDRDRRPVPNALLDIWHAAPNGMYEQQDPHQPEMHLRGRFATDTRGFYALRCLRPPPYPVPDDGPAGKLLRLLDRHPYRPAHIHLIVSKDGYETLTTQLFDAEDAYLDNDSVFAVKGDLVAEFKPFGGGAGGGGVDGAGTGPPNAGAMGEHRDGNGDGLDAIYVKWKVGFDIVLAEA